MVIKIINEFSLIAIRPQDAREAEAHLLTTAMTPSAKNSNELAHLCVDAPTLQMTAVLAPILILYVQKRTLLAPSKGCKNVTSKNHCVENEEVFMTLLLPFLHKETADSHYMNSDGKIEERSA